MSKEIALSLVVGAALRSGFMTVFGSAKNAVAALGSEITTAKKHHATLAQTIRTQTPAAGSAVAKLRQQYRRLGNEIKTAEKRELRLGAAIAAQEKARARRGELRGQMREAATTTAAVALPVVGAIKQFMEQERATTNMRVAFMDKTGGVGAAFDKIRIQALELGNALPGTTTDFMNLGRVLREQGLQPDVIAGGAFKAAAYMNVVLETPQEFGGEFIAKLMEARGIADSDLLKAADVVQRARFGFGIKPGEMLDSMKYDAATANVLNIKGLANTEKLLAVQGMGAQVGLEGANFGANFSQFLQRMAKGPAMMAQAKRGMKSEAQDMLNDLGVTFEFFDKAGKFKGIDAMVKELQKLEQIKKSKYGERGALLVSEQLFGAEASRPAMIIASRGVEGYQRNLQIMREQASLQQRLAEKSKTLSNSWEAVTGTAANLAATLGGVFGDDLKGWFKSANEFIGGPMQQWVKENKGLIKTGVGLVLGLLAGKVAFLGIAYGANLAFAPIRSLWTIFSLFSTKLSIFKLIRLGQLGKMAGMLRMFGMSAGRAVKVAGWLGKAWSFLSVGALKLGKVLWHAALLGGKALIKLGIAMLTTPIGWFVLGVAAVAGVAYLIYRNWDKIAPFMGRVWASIKSAFNSAWVWFSSLPARFLQLGSNLIDGLVLGITNKLQAAKKAIVGVGQSIKGWFAGALGIKSPSRVFMGFGLNIGEGAALGILQSVPSVQKAVGKLGALRMQTGMQGALRAVVSNPIAAGASVPIQVHYNPQITVTAGGNAQQTAGAINSALQGNLREFERMLDRVLSNKQRRSLVG